MTRYVVSLLHHTRGNPHLALGASPRSGIALLRLAKAHALVSRREYVTPDDIRAMAEPVLGHRLLLAPEARSAGSVRPTSCAKHSRARRHRCEAPKFRRLRARGRRPRRLVGVWLDAARGRRRRARAGRSVLASLGAARPGRSTSSDACSRRAARGERRSSSSARRRRRLLGGRSSLRQRLGTSRAEAADAPAQAEIVFSGLPRGRHVLGPLEVTLTDPLGLERVEESLDEASSSSSARASRRSRRSSRARARASPAPPARRSAGRPASRSMRSATTHRVSRCGPFTGRARPDAAA